MHIPAIYDILDDNINLSFNFGEVALRNLNFKGYWCNIDIFQTKPISAAYEPIIDINGKENRKILLYISYPISQKLPVLSFKNGYICYTPNQYKHYFLDCNISPEEYLQTFQSKTRSTLKRKIKKVSSSCTHTEYFKVYKSPEEILEFLPLAKEISDKSFQFQFLNQGLKYSDLYINEYLERAREGKILGFILFVEDKPVAYNLNPIYDGGVMIYYYTGYDSNYSEYSPGTVLQYKTIEFAMNSDFVNKYDLCIGEGKHKEYFTEQFIFCGDIYYFPLNIKHSFILISKVAFDNLIKVIKNTGKLFFNLDKVKKWMRNNLKRNK
ncbi:GNAT family N-acetyltransferase [Cecembia calidifontis]|jgi:hypothetical protein|uniref:Acetyltransferase (GNAT) family protein n=1 Tax=Cecembia calidifontis TaxID=1187080 RepID=A0A4Q7P9Y7_9BACT|nr:GNAT family N-acetyltransferase [Cecembia calidifontis]RZS96991.1 acetyltransferase (GNAT) family protein [Cecembia calidifontis]